MCQSSRKQHRNTGRPFYYTGEMDGATLQQGVDKEPHENHAGTKENENDQLKAATTFEDLLKAAVPRGRWALMVMVACALGT